MEHLPLLLSCRSERLLPQTEIALRKSLRSSPNLLSSVLADCPGVIEELSVHLKLYLLPGFHSPDGCEEPPAPRDCLSLIYSLPADGWGHKDELGLSGQGWIHQHISNSTEEVRACAASASVLRAGIKLPAAACSSRRMEDALERV